MFDFKWKENGSIKLLIIVGTRPEIIPLAATIKRCREYFDCCVAHTGQNYDKNLNDIFWSDFELGGPDVWMNVVGENLGQTCGNVIARSYELMAEIKPDALLVLGDTNSCLSAISAKRLHIPIFHMEAGNRCKDECLPEETNRRIVDVISDVNLPWDQWPGKEMLMETMAESAKAVCDYFGKKIVFINVLRRMSVDCDCAGTSAAEPTIPDIGILASTDILAIDQASIDLVYGRPAAEKHDLVERIESRRGLHQLTAMKALGMGNDQYDLITVP